MSYLNNTLDRIFVGFVYTAIIVGMVIIFFWIVPRDLERNQKAEAWAQEHKCEYIGNARDLNSVKFFECNGEIKIVRIK